MLNVQRSIYASEGLLIEAKLTETEFQRAPRERIERYRDFAYAFDIHALPQLNGYYLHYQLIRGVLAAFAEEDARYCVLCDARRPDLVDAWFTVASAVKLASLRSRLQLATWQEISATLPKSLRLWLAEKYGIECEQSSRPGYLAENDKTKSVQRRPSDVSPA